MLKLERKVGEGFVLSYRGEVLGTISLAEIRGERRASLCFDLVEECRVMREELVAAAEPSPSAA